MEFAHEIPIQCENQMDIEGSKKLTWNKDDIYFKSPLFKMTVTRSHIHCTASSKLIIPSESLIHIYSMTKKLLLLVTTYFEWLVMKSFLVDEVSFVQVGAEGAGLRFWRSHFNSSMMLVGFYSNSASPLLLCWCVKLLLILTVA